MGMSKVATEKEKFLRNYYLKAKRSVAKATTEGMPARMGHRRKVACRQCRS